MAGFESVIICGRDPNTHTPVAIEASAGGILTSLPTILYAGQQTVAVAGTAVVLAASQSLRSGVRVKADTTNNGFVYVGNASVDSTHGFILAGGDEVFIEIDDISKVYIDASINDQGVSYVAS